jgi:hypothetical protein
VVDEIHAAEDHGEEDESDVGANQDQAAPKRILKFFH